MRSRSAAALGLALCLPLAACAAAGPAGSAGTSASATQEAQSPGARQTAGLVRQAARTLTEMRRDTRNKALDTAIAEARAIIVLPGVYQAGFIYSVHGGTGVLVARRADGGWGAPVFMGMGGVGYGLQAGLEKSRLVLVITEDEILDRILANGLNLEANTEYDIVGVRESTGVDTRTAERPVMVFTDGVGIMAGVALRGGLLSLNRTMTREYYGANAGSAEEIMRGIDAPGMDTFALWAALGVEPSGPAITTVRRP